MILRRSEFKPPAPLEHGTARRFTKTADDQTHDVTDQEAAKLNNIINHMNGVIQKLEAEAPGAFEPLHGAGFAATYHIGVAAFKDQISKVQGHDP